MGDRLIVSGTCPGPTIIDKDLIIEGVRTAETRPLLHAHHRGVVMTVDKGVTATLADVALSGGRGPFSADGPKKYRNRPSGVENRGHLTLDGVLVRGSRGIGVVDMGTLRMKGDTAVGLNAYSEGGNVYSDGVHNTGRLVFNGLAMVRQNRGVINEGTLVMNGASSIHNTLYGVTNSGSMTMNDSSVSDGVENSGTLTLNDDSRSGVVNEGTATLNDHSTLGGAYNGPGSRLTMNDASQITNGRDDHAPTLVLNGTSQISHNWLRVENSGSVILNGSSAIRNNDRTKYVLFCAAHCPPTPRLVGAGVSNRGSLTLNDASSITGNIAAESGGGVYLWEGTGASPTMTGSSTISGNSAGKGGGVYAGAGSVLTGVSCGSQTGANVYGNDPDDCHVEP